jgi:hypothetical protein
MPSSEYPEAVLEYVQAQGWTTNITELREGAYIVAGTREADSSPKKMLLMVVCDPENKVTSEHVEYLVNAGREKNVDSVLLTHTVGITEKAREIGKEYGIGVIDSKKYVPMPNQVTLMLILMRSRCPRLNQSRKLIYHPTQT